MESMERKFIVCTARECMFGLEKIDGQCNICRYRKDLVVTSKVMPILIETKNEYDIACYKNEKLPLHNKCPFGYSETSEKCFGCIRGQKLIKKSETKEIGYGIH